MRFRRYCSEARWQRKAGDRLPPPVRVGVEG